MKDVYSISKTIIPLNHGNKIRAGIACNKIPCYMSDSQTASIFLKKLKYFEVTLNILEFYCA